MTASSMHYLVVVDVLQVKNAIINIMNELIKNRSIKHDQHDLDVPH